MAFVPFAAALAGTTAAVVGAGVKAYGMLKQGKAEKQMAYEQAKVDDNNEIRLGYAAIQEQQQVQREISVMREERLRAIGAQRAAVGASGLTESGSVLDVMTDTSINVEHEIAMAKYRGDVNAWNIRNQQADMRDTARLRRMAGDNAYKSAKLAAGGTLISGLSSAAFNFASLRA